MNINNSTDQLPRNERSRPNRPPNQPYTHNTGNQDANRFSYNPNQRNTGNFPRPQDFQVNSNSGNRDRDHRYSSNHNSPQQQPSNRNPQQTTNIQGNRPEGRLRQYSRALLSKIIDNSLSLREYANITPRELTTILGMVQDQDQELIAHIPTVLNNISPYLFELCDRSDNKYITESIKKVFFCANKNQDALPICRRIIAKLIVRPRLNISKLTNDEITQLIKTLSIIKVTNRDDPKISEHILELLSNLNQKEIKAIDFETIINALNYTDVSKLNFNRFIDKHVDDFLKSLTTFKQNTLCNLLELIGCSFTDRNIHEEVTKLIQTTLVNIKYKELPANNLVNYASGLMLLDSIYYNAFNMSRLISAIEEINSRDLDESCIQRVEKGLRHIKRQHSELGKAITTCLLKFCKIHSGQSVDINYHLLGALNNFQFSEEESLSIKPLILKLAKEIVDKQPEIFPIFICDIAKSFTRLSLTRAEKVGVDAAILKIVDRDIKTIYPTFNLRSKTEVASALVQVAVTEENQEIFRRFFASLLPKVDFSTVFTHYHRDLLEYISKSSIHEAPQQNYVNEIITSVNNHKIRPGDITFIVESLRRLKTIHKYHGLDDALQKLEGLLKSYAATIQADGFVPKLYDHEDIALKAIILKRIHDALEYRPENAPHDSEITIEEVVDFREVERNSLQQLPTPQEELPITVSSRFSSIPNFSANSDSNGLIPCVLEQHREQIIEALSNSSNSHGRFSLDLNQPGLHDLAEDLNVISQGNPSCSAIYNHLSIYHSGVGPNHPVFVPAPPVSRQPCNLPAYAVESFFDLWADTARAAIEGSELPTSGLVLIEISSEKYQPMTYTRTHGVLEFHPFHMAQHNALITDPMKFENGVICVSSAGSLLKRPDLIVIFRKRKATNLQLNDLYSKKIKVSDGSDAPSTDNKRPAPAMVDPFALPQLAKSDGLHRQRTTIKNSEVGIEQISQRRHIQLLPTTISDLQTIISTYSSPTSATPQQMKFYEAMFPHLSKQDIQAIHSSLTSNHTMSIDAPCIYDEKFFSLLVLWIMSDEKCIVGLQTSDLEEFKTHFVNKLNKFEKESLLSVAWKLANGEEVPLPVIRSVILDDSISIRLRLQLCHGLKNNRSTLLGELYRSQATIYQDDPEFQNIAKNYPNDTSRAVLAYFTLLQTGSELDEILEACRQFNRPPTNFASQVKATDNEARADVLLASETFVITTETLLVNYAKLNTLTELNPRVFLPLSDAEGHRAVYDAVGKGRLMVWSDRSSLKNQLELMRLLDIERSTLRMQTIIKSLTRKPDHAQYVELLSLIVLTQKIIQLSQLDAKPSLNNVENKVIHHSERVAAKDAIYKYFHPRNAGRKLLKTLATNDARTMIYLVSSGMENMQEHITQLQLRFIFKFTIEQITGSSKIRQFTQGTEQQPKIYIVTSGVLPSRIPSFPLLVDPFMNHHGAISWHTNKVIRFSTQKSERHPLNEIEISSKLDYAGCFADGDLAMLDETMRKQLALLIKSCRVTPELVRNIKSTCRLTPEAMAVSIDLLDALKSVPPLPSNSQPPQDGPIVIDGITLRLKPVLRDGSCLYQCFVDSGIMQDVTSVEECRKALTDIILSDPNGYRNLMGEEEVLSVTNAIFFYEGPEKERYETALATLNSLRLTQNPSLPQYSQLSADFLDHLFNLYIDVSKNTPLWGGFLEMNAFSNTYEVTIAIVTEGQIYQIIEPSNGYQKNIYLRYQDNHYDYYVKE
ncbi:MAG: hypothetical protein Q8K75_01330 [Chlamydiales bacterium]|nr:hypothetical protein [Chlamydiales bacterium]